LESSVGGLSQNPVNIRDLMLRCFLLAPIAMSASSRLAADRLPTGAALVNEAATCD
jgi:hypothetical protein